MKLVGLLYAGILLCVLTPAAFGADGEGFYTGASFGYNAGQVHAGQVSDPNVYHANTNGVSVDARLGWHKKVIQWAVGGELTIGYLNTDGHIATASAGGQVYTDSRLNSYGTMAARAGYYLTNDWLLFGRLGIAVAQLDSSTSQSCPTGACNLVSSTADTDNVTFGLVAGTGLSFQLSDRISLRTEYEHLHFREELALPKGAGPAWNHDIDSHNIKLGLDYKF